MTQTTLFQGSLACTLAARLPPLDPLMSFLHNGLYGCWVVASPGQWLEGKGKAHVMLVEHARRRAGVSSGAVPRRVVYRPVRRLTRGEC